MFELPEKSGTFLRLLILDGIGSILLAIGLAAYFADLHLMPADWRFEGYAVVLIVIGVLLIIPFIAFMVKSILAKLNI